MLMVTRLFLSGQTSHVLQLIAALRRLGVAADLALSHPPPPSVAGPCRAAAAAYGIDWTVHPTPSSLAARVAAGRYDLVHAHSSHAWLPAARAATLSGRPLVLTAHGARLSRPELQPALQRARLVIAVGHRFARELGPAARRVRVIPNGVDLERFRPHERLSPEQPPAGPLRAAWFGREGETRRAVRCFALAARALQRRGIPVEAVLIGPSRPCAGVPALGWLADPAPLLARQHVVVASGLALREAMAAGAAALLAGTRYGGIVWPARLGPDADLGGRAGPGLRPLRVGALVRDLLRLHADRRLLAWLRWASRRAAERYFDAADMARRTLEAYGQVLRWRG